MALNLTEFRSSFGEHELARPTMFEVVITPLNAVFTGGIFSASPESPRRFRCKSASIPGRAIQSIDFTDYGSPKKFAVGALYEPINLEFIMSTDNAEHKFFEDWQNTIIQNSMQRISTGYADVEYYDNYVTSVLIKQYNKKGSIIATHALTEAYPIAVQATQLNWDDTNSYLKLTVQMYYHRFTSSYADEDGVVVSAKSGGLDSVAGLFGSADNVIRSASASANALTKTISTINNNLTRISDGVRTITGAVNQIVKDVQAVTAPIVQTVNQTISTVNNVVGTVKSTINQVKGAINSVENVASAIGDVNLNSIQSSINSINAIGAAVNVASTNVNSAVFSTTGLSILAVDSVEDLLDNPYTKPPSE